MGARADEALRKARAAQNDADDAQREAKRAYEKAKSVETWAEREFSAHQSQINSNYSEIKGHHDRLDSHDLQLSQLSFELEKVKKDIAFLAKVFDHLPGNLAETAIEIVKTLDAETDSRGSIEGSESQERLGIKSLEFQEGYNVRQKIEHDKQEREQLEYKEHAERYQVQYTWLSELQQKLRASKELQAIKQYFISKNKYDIYNKLQSLEFAPLPFPSPYPHQTGPSYPPSTGCQPVQHCHPAPAYPPLTFGWPGFQQPHHSHIVSHSHMTYPGVAMPVMRSGW